MTGSKPRRGLQGVGTALPTMERSWTPAAERTTPALGVEALYRAHAQDVFRLVSRLLGPGATRADVDDLVQDVFITADRALKRYRGDGTPYSFVYGVTTRVVMRSLRGRRRYRQMIARFEAADATQSAVPPSPEETVVQREQVRRVWAAVLRVKPERRVVFILFQLEGRTATEIAEALQLSEEAVRSRLRRARAEVEAHLEREGQR